MSEIESAAGFSPPPRRAPEPGWPLTHWAEGLADAFAARPESVLIAAAAGGMVLGWLLKRR